SSFANAKKIPSNTSNICQRNLEGRGGFSVGGGAKPRTRSGASQVTGVALELHRDAGRSREAFVILRLVLGAKLDAVGRCVVGAGGVVERTALERDFARETKPLQVGDHIGLGARLQGVFPLGLALLQLSLV